jgi:hypothetical protein
VHDDASVWPSPSANVVRTERTMTWTRFCTDAPRIAEIFQRRHAATGKLCFLGTIKADGSPRISPMEPRIFDNHLWLVGMPNTRKFADLARDPRFTLHTATVDPNVEDGDAKVWGTVTHIDDYDVQQRFAEELFQEIGLDIRGQHFDQFLQADIIGASAVTLSEGNLDIATWRRGDQEKVSRKH